MCVSTATSAAVYTSTASEPLSSQADVHHEYRQALACWKLALRIRREWVLPTAWQLVTPLQGGAYLPGLSTT